ncbi:MAG: Arc family DNA-binding protein [Bacteroidales bacterium]|nr:Arc family DNA-binding protein [Candidatus Scybalousia scybalohippi]
MIGKDSTKLIFTLPKVLYEKLKQKAEAQNRSMANLLVTILQDYFNKDDSENHE